jgi:excinuclease UvrABC nuclease subunit
LGGGITYAKRYSISACLGISVDTDTDGADSKISAQQLKRKPTLSNERIDGLVKHLQTFSEIEQASEFEKIKEKFDISQAQIKNIYERIKL